MVWDQRRKKFTTGVSPGVLCRSLMCIHLPLRHCNPCRRDRANVSSVPYPQSKLGHRLPAEILVCGVGCSLLLIAP